MWRLGETSGCNSFFGLCLMQSEMHSFYTGSLCKWVAIKRCNEDSHFFFFHFLKHCKRSPENLLSLLLAFSCSPVCGSRRVSDFPVCRFPESYGFTLSLSFETVGFGLCSRSTRVFIISSLNHNHYKH